MRILLTILLAGSLLPAWMTDVQGAGVAIRFNGYWIAASGITDDQGRLLQDRRKSSPPASYCFIGTNGDLRTTDRMAMQDAGYELLRYAGRGGWLARVNRSMSEKPVPSTILFTQPLLPEMKVDRAFASPVAAGECGVVVHTFTGVDEKPLLELARSHEAQVTAGVERGNMKRIGLRVSAARLLDLCKAIAQEEGVFFIERDRGVELFCNDAVRILQSGSSTGTALLFNRGLRGEGQIIAICDTGIDADSCYVRHTDGTLPPVNVGTAGIVVEATRRKVIAVDFLDLSENPLNVTHWDTQDHGTTVAGCAGGSLLTDPLVNNHFNGLAPACQFVVQDAGFAIDDCADLPGLGCPVVDLNPILNQAYLQGARFHNNSWGDRENFFPHNTYTARCEDVDDFTWQHKDFLVVCAAGNDGATGTVSSPGTAKNALSVGGTGNGAGANAIISFSSRGPASDGRIKPDVCAPATATMADNDLNITTNNCTTRGSAGTSFSSPFAAGACALIRNYLQAGFYPSGSANIGDALAHPTSALIKALLINGATDVTTAADIPGLAQGWGRIYLDGVLYFTGDASRLYLDDHHMGYTSSTDLPVQYNVEVLSSNIPLKITLVWSDYPGTPGADPQLVNDLDLVLVAGNDTYLGNHFMNGFSVTGGTSDDLNNVEQIYLAVPPAGVHELRVIPRTIPQGPQDYALVVTGNTQVVNTASAPHWRAY